jgi:hypothetical protein
MSDRRGGIHRIPERWATLLAADMRRLPKQSAGAATSAAGKIEARLVDQVETPVEFDPDERIEVWHKLGPIVIGWDTPQARAFYYAFTIDTHPSSI